MVKFKVHFPSCSKWAESISSSIPANFMIERVIGHGSKETWFDDHLRTWFEGFENEDMVRMGKIPKWDMVRKYGEQKSMTSIITQLSGNPLHLEIDWT